MIKLRYLILIIMMSGIRDFFMCSACKCCFMTYLNNTMPHNYCPNCGKGLIEGDDLNNG